MSRRKFLSLPPHLSSPLLVGGATPSAAAMDTLDDLIPLQLALGHSADTRTPRVVHVL